MNSLFGSNIVPAVLNGAGTKRNAGGKYIYYSLGVFMCENIG